MALLAPTQVEINRGSLGSRFQLVYVESAGNAETVTLPFDQVRDTAWCGDTSADVANFTITTRNTGSTIITCNSGGTVAGYLLVLIG